ncbi:thiamine biosynthesis protein ThiJ [Sporolactobacillus shoreae]|uniref:Thiamine biosynthesis protein ThiJ n=1 Tax=Sporolactobacillus shoreae TaxID=1465501 RepID=A0A4Z0GNP4_9BACL|nr:type 1 glutamine amidotransferase domain-containing protein [Sporolactobacillus shoreae]TGA97985.1 thiamine biosynthesis protein ThiJ [Sporolactobacillus shoreae]
MGKKVLIPIPSRDFDPTEVVTPWLRLRAAGYQPIFATPDGKRGYTDPLLLKGVLFGRLGAKKEIVESYHSQLGKDSSFLNPIVYETVSAADYDGLLLPGGHAPGMKTYLESTALQKTVLEFWNSKKPIAAICHGTIVLARTIDPETGRSIIYNKTMTSLTKLLERTAYYLTAWARGSYYRTYPEYVQDEVSGTMRDRANYQTGPLPTKPFFVRDGKLLTARWPGDADLFADEFVKMLDEARLFRVKS